MNKPIHPVISSDGGNIAYDGDLYGWAIEQAGFLRAGKVELVDWANLAEELEGMARSEYRSLESALRILLLHLLKWEAQPGLRSKSWLYSIQEHGDRYQRLLAENPSLKQHVEAIRADAHRSARRLAASETGLDIDLFPVEPLGWNSIANPPAREEDLPAR
ncbi:DUF29 domain-containing protein [Sphingomonas bacterium]|uniref:DUF29 domain-containing protein n=1 Tax=Sphingomonas bacterium TaxID=1895847 RepID=UPI0015769B75|nr:DUF29 domain-containing protein [Sphingomonas bacterium]